MNMDVEILSTKVLGCINNRQIKAFRLRVSFVKLVINTSQYLQVVSDIRYSYNLILVLLYAWLFHMEFHRERKEINSIQEYYD